jgi:hypothetical protein
MHFEPTMLGAFKENPVFFALAALLGALGFALVIVALIALGKKPGIAAAVGLAAAVAGLLTMGAGTVGWFTARAHTLGAVSAPGLDARDRERILAYGNADASMPLKFGFGLGAIPLLAGAALGVAALGRARRK